MELLILALIWLLLTGGLIWFTALAWWACALIALAVVVTGTLIYVEAT